MIVGRSWIYSEGSLAKIFGVVFIIGWLSSLQLGSLVGVGRSVFYGIPDPSEIDRSLVSSQGFDLLPILGRLYDMTL